MKFVKFAFIAGMLAVILPAGKAWSLTAAEIIKAGFDHYRGKASIATIEMVIHRPTWERRMTMEGWTKGTDRSLIRITAPAKDKDNGTLKKGRSMWTYNPKVNRVVKLPPALMSQAWMGSDFSNNDLAKSDSIIKDYIHTLIDTETLEGREVYVIRSMPKPDAAVVWGMQIIRIRDDRIILSQEFFDEDLEPVKRMTADQIEMLGGRMFPRRWKMAENDKPNQYTLLLYHNLAFLDDLPDNTFTINRLKSSTRR